MACYYAIANVVVPSLTWIDVKVPIACSKITIENSGINPMYLRRAGAPGDKKRIPGGVELVVSSLAVTWEPGDVIGQLQCPNIDTSATLTFTR
jgi:hypothetical protein